MTLEEALEFADECSGDLKMYFDDELDKQDWRIACIRLAEEVRLLLTEKRVLRALAKCDCGAEFTADYPGMCVSCAIARDNQHSPYEIQKP